MKVLILSDSHGNIEHMERAVELVNPRLIVHLGDCWRDAEELHGLYANIPLEQVLGNCDFGRFESAERLLFLEDKRVLIAHGHTLHVKHGLLSARYRAQELGADILLFGHTHVPLVENDGTLLLLNPGSIGDRSRPTYGVLEWKDGQCRSGVYALP